MDYKTIQLEMKEGVATISLNRVEALNAMDMAMAEELMDVAVRCDEDHAI